MPVVHSPFLGPVRRTLGAVEIENNGTARRLSCRPSHPRPVQRFQAIQVGLSGQYLRLEAGHLTHRRRTLLGRPSPDQLAEDRIDSQTFGVVHVLVTGQAGVDRLAQQSGEGVAFVQTASGIDQRSRGVRREAKLLVEFPVRQQATVTRHSRTAKLQAHGGVEIKAQTPLFAFTHWVSPLMTAPAGRNPSIPSVSARQQRVFLDVIWEMRV